MSRRNLIFSKASAIVLSVVLLLTALPISAAEYSDIIPAINNTHPYSVYENKTMFYGDMEVIGNTSIANGRLQFGYFNADGSTIDTTKADYLEMDVWSDVKVDNNLQLWLSSNVWEESGRALFLLPPLKVGWNHVVINLNDVLSYANFAAVQYDRAAIKSLFLRGIPQTAENKEFSLKFANAAFTSDEFLPEFMTDYTYPYTLFEKRGLFWKWHKPKGTKSDFTDSIAINDGNGVDITNAKYIEFDVEINVDIANLVFWLSTSSGDLPARRRYDTGALKKGINHVSIDISRYVSEYEEDFAKWNAAEIKTLFLEMTAENSDFDFNFYNFAFTSDSPYTKPEPEPDYDFSGDPVLDYRKDFNWGSVMHAPGWGMPYRPDNLELQIKQLSDAGCTLLRVDGADNFSHIDKTVKLCNAYNVKVMLVVYIPNRTFDAGAKLDLEAVKTHFRIYATRYDGKHGCGKIDYIQIDNEMDVSLMGWTGYETQGTEIGNYSASALEVTAKQVRAASEGIKSAGTDVKRIINIAWIHYGMLKYFKQVGIEWDITGHDWYQDMFSYGSDPNEYYASGKEIYDLFGKPIIICETNMWFNVWNGQSVYPDYSKPSFWDPLIDALQDYYAKDYVVGCVIYEFYDEPMMQTSDAWNGEAHFGMMEVNENGSFKSAKPVYYRCRHLFGGSAGQMLSWHDVEAQYTVYGEKNILDLIKCKKLLLSDNDAYSADADMTIDGYVDASDFVILKKTLFENL